MRENRFVNALSRSSRLARLPSLSGRPTPCTRTTCCPRRSARAQRTNSFSCAVPTLTPVPPPFDTMHAALIDDPNAIYGALPKLGVLRDEKLVPGDSRPPFNGRDLSTRRTFPVRMAHALHPAGIP